MLLFYTCPELYFHFQCNSTLNIIPSWLSGLFRDTESLLLFYLTQEYFILCSFYPLTTSSPVFSLSLSPGTVMTTPNLLTFSFFNVRFPHYVFFLWNYEYNCFANVYIFRFSANNSFHFIFLLLWKAWGCQLRVCRNNGVLQDFWQANPSEVWS